MQMYTRKAHILYFAHLLQCWAQTILRHRSNRRPETRLSCRSIGPFLPSSPWRPQRRRNKTPAGLSSHEPGQVVGKTRLHSLTVMVRAKKECLVGCGEKWQGRKEVGGVSLYGSCSIKRRREKGIRVCFPNSSGCFWMAGLSATF